MALIKTLVSIITGVVGAGVAALPIVAPVAGAVLVGKIAFDTYKGA